MVSTETQEQIKLFQWIKLHKNLRYCSIHIPNEGKRSLAMGRTMKKMGLRAGASDVFIAKPNSKYHGLWIELKAMDSEGRYRKPSTKQIVFLEDMRNNGYAGLVCNGADEAIRVIETYLVS